MEFDEFIINKLRSLVPLLQKDTDIYVNKVDAIGELFIGKEVELEDIIYDYNDSEVRLEAMMVCKQMSTMPKLRIFYDLSVAEKNPELKKWAGILFRQEHLLETVKTYKPDNDEDAEQKH
jgi:hypothetical protein